MLSSLLNKTNLLVIVVCVVVIILVMVALFGENFKSLFAGNGFAEGMASHRPSSQTRIIMTNSRA